MHYFRKIVIDRFLLVLMAICVLVILSNYSSGTILSGWDTLHPEFDISMYWKRITNVWQEHQGLGAPPTQSHAAEIPRMLIYGTLNALLPMNMVRYSYIWLMMILGPTGVYYFLLYLLNKNGKKGTSAHIGAFLGGLFYILNVGTVQHFIVILEMFATNWGFLGFIFLFLTQYLDTGRRKSLFWLSCTLIFSASMSHTATLWYVFFIGYVGYIFFYSFLNIWEDRSRNNTVLVLKRAGISLGVVLLFNLYWILPNIYYSLLYSQDIVHAKINRLFSEEAYLNNRYFGNINDLLLMKNFLFRWYVATPVINSQGFYGQPVYDHLLLKSWISHLENPFVLAIAYSLSLLGIGGAGYGFYRKNKVIMCLAPITFGCGAFMLSSTPGFSHVIEWLRSQNMLLKELLRFPFTKMSIYYIFGLCIYFGYLMAFAADKFSKLTKNKQYGLSVFTYLAAFAIIVYAMPVFQGQFIGEVIRVKLPFEYDLMFKRFGRDDNGRILMLPMNTVYGWTYYQWDIGGKPQIYQGGGFTWFGFNQPTLNREFDRWYYPNEEAYKEFSYALYSKNTSLFNKLLHKYNIHWIVLDENITAPGGEPEYKKLIYPETKELLKNSKNVTFSYQFGPHIGVYSIDDNQKKEPVAVLTNYNRVDPPYRWNYLDYSYAVNGNYISAPYDSRKDQPAQAALPNSLVYPMRAMLDNQERVNKNVLQVGNADYTFKASANINDPGSFQTPPISAVESRVPARLTIDSATNKLKVRYLLPFPKNQPVVQDQVSIPNDSTQLIIKNTLFDIPSASGNQILGDTLVDTDLPLEIEALNPNVKLASSSGILKQLTLPTKTRNPALTLSSPIFAAEGYNVTLEEITNASRDCGIKPSAESHKTIRFDAKNQGIAVYETIDGVICDKLNFKTAAQDTGYILAIESQNYKGLPLRICFEDPVSRQCVLEDELSKFDHWDTDYFIIPPYMQDSSYTFTIRNVSIGKAPTLNETKSIKLIPFTYNWLQSLGYVPDKYKPHTATPGKTPSVSLKKSSPTRYEAKLSNINEGDVITLDEAYEKGWHAYKVNSVLGRLFPPLFGSTVGKHILVNNWANGWQVSQNEASELQNSQLVLYYLPQYLFYTGGLILLAFLLIVIHPVRQWHKYKHLLRYLT